MNSLIVWHEEGEDLRFYYVQNMSPIDIEIFTRINGKYIGDITVAEEDVELINEMQVKYCDEEYEDLPQVLNNTLLFNVGYVG